MRPAPILHFGGPDRPARALTDLLRARVDASLPGDEIHWVTYYFRDRPLARALIAAADRGVKVSLQVEGSPRRRSANRAVLDLLAAHGLGGGLTISHSPKWSRKLHPHLHAKLYLFSGSQPAAFIGSFNPSGDDPETDPDVIAEIGDQDRGHNLLVELVEPALVQGLIEQAMFWRGRASSFWLRFAALQNRTLGGPALRLSFFPRLRTRLVEQRLAGAARGDRIRGALSHVKPGPFTRALCTAATRGAEVDLIVHDTERRVPESMLRDLRASGIRVRRYRHAAGLPVHSKYLLLEQGDATTAWFGSYNFNNRSRLINLELLAECTEPAVTAALQARFAALGAEVESQQSSGELHAQPQVAAQHIATAVRGDAG